MLTGDTVIYRNRTSDECNKVGTASFRTKLATRRTVPICAVPLSFSRTFVKYSCVLLFAARMLEPPYDSSPTLALRQIDLS